MADRKVNDFDWNVFLKSEPHQETKDREPTLDNVFRSILNKYSGKEDTEDSGVSDEDFLKIINRSSQPAKNTGSLAKAILQEKLASSAGVIKNLNQKAKLSIFMNRFIISSILIVIIISCLYTFVLI